MLIGFVTAYLVLSIAIGLYAATRVKNSTDYVAAGRNLPLYIVTATVFATWFGSETVLGISATFIDEGLRGLWSDPFGASLCLILAGLFFARPLYRMNLLTLGDYYRTRYGRTVEVLCSLAIVVSYLGWVSAQISALGLVFNILSEGSISAETGMLVGAGIVLAYTLFGGMWSVALTDFMQMAIIIVGLAYIAWLVGDMAGGVGAVVAHTDEAGKLNFLPAFDAKDIIAFTAGILTMGFGSIPQQDVFQRFNAARNERIAVQGTLLGGSGYFLFAFIPLFIAYSATLIDPALVANYQESDSQQILPQLILEHTPLFAQVLFFGALLSAIMSTASGTLLAPSVTFSENILRSTFRGMNDRQFLVMTRVVVVLFALLVTWYAIHTDESIHGMVENAYKVTLATAFVPLAFGLYWKRASTQGALVSIVAGLAVWVLLEIVAPEADVPPHFAGMLAGVVGMVVGSLAPQTLVRQSHGHSAHLNIGAHPQSRN
ncbi:sodium/solute symporter transmembrane protein [Azoarcus olearius]|uniref:sodium:solute symporter family protein n=1 Tax=Azoarcus sp. (strain BH72) TaxID=418699 RepID=UPI000806328F|nr:sodium:solute symporter family protein [Azoarcus olearius]ANQ83464.1 sodium/solute symporter transmembrane protein [Azoarcus olearius]